MLSSFFYLNEKEIDSQYNQTGKIIFNKYEKLISKSRKGSFKITVGSLLKAMGINLGEINADGNLEKNISNKVEYILTYEQKLAIIIRYLIENHRLINLNKKNNVDFNIGSNVFFEGFFTLFEKINSNINVSLLHGKINNMTISLYFSVKKMEPSVYTYLSYEITNNLISGYGTIVKIKESQLIIRPSAFGINLGKILVDKQNKK